MMKKNLYKILLITGLSIGTSSAIAGSNNGYTTAANVYSGHSSLGWYGGGVAYQLALWQKKADVAVKVDDSVAVNPENNSEQESTAVAVDTATPKTQEVNPAISLEVSPPKAPDAPKAPEASMTETH